MKKSLKIIACLVMSSMLLLLSLAGMAEELVNYNPPVVTVKGGQLRGFLDGATYTFRGIQYATAERWQMPQPVEPWEGVKNAQSYGAISPIAKQTAVGSDEFVWQHRYWVQNEECMNLNIWTQSLDSSAKKPVIVFFHGGGFSNGSSIEAYAYDGKNLSEFGDVVTVTVNHRLNVLGCLDLSAYGEEYKNSANITMADLVAALEWVQENIEAFGGDPERVMIFGQSGGSVKTMLMYYMPTAEGLFTSGIGMSGGVLALGQGESARVAELILKKFDLDGTQIDQLKEIPYDELIIVADEALAEIAQERGGWAMWAPTIDGEYILENWTEYAKNVPCMQGSVFSEFTGTLATGTGKNEWADEEIEAKLLEAYGDNKDAIVEEFTSLFPGKPVQDVLYYSNRYSGFFDVVNNTSIALAQSNAPVYQYLFTYEFPVNGGITSFHCGDLIFTFHNVGMPECVIGTGGTAGAYALQDKMAQAWINFAATGNPSQEGLEWTPWSAEEMHTVIFDAETECRPFDDAKLCELLAQ